METPLCASPNLHIQNAILRAPDPANDDTIYIVYYIVGLESEGVDKDRSGTAQELLPTPQLLHPRDLTWLSP